MIKTNLFRFGQVRQTQCNNLLLLTDHESTTIQEATRQIKVQPVYDWCLEMGI